MQCLIDLSSCQTIRDADQADAVMADAATLAAEPAGTIWQSAANAGRPRYLTCPMADFQDEAALYARLAALKPSGIHLSDARTRADLEHASTLLRVMEVRLSLPQATLTLIASLATTAASSFHLPSFAKTHPRLRACLFDPQALARDLATDDWNADAVRQVQATLLLVARAANSPALKLEIAAGGTVCYRPLAS